MRRFLVLAGVTAAMALSGCADLAGFNLAPGAATAPFQTAPTAARPAPAAPLPPGATADPGARRTAAAAEAACVSQGNAQGLNVQQVVGTRDVGGTSRDVMLRVARGQQVFDIRCNFDYASGQARIMTL
jgi:hypothetical protein